jgi:hypothetical protein
MFLSKIKLFAKVEPQGQKHRAETVDIVKLRNIILQHSYIYLSNRINGIECFGMGIENVHEKPGNLDNLVIS